MFTSKIKDSNNVLNIYLYTPDKHLLMNYYKVADNNLSEFWPKNVDFFG